MKNGEKIKGNMLRERMGERDLICKDNKVHIVFDHTICRPSMIDDTKKRGEKIWEKVGSCKEYSEYEKKVEELGLICCKSCAKKIDKYCF